MSTFAKPAPEALRAVATIRALRLPSIPALALYLASLLCELPVIFVRWLVLLAIATLVLLIKEGSPDGAEGIALYALIPTGWAIFALITPLGGGWWWRANLGGRVPSQRERGTYEHALERLRQSSSTSLRTPSRWFVLDVPEPDAAVCGDTLALSRGLLESPYLPAVLAHELGHLVTSDGKLTAAINRLVIESPPKLREKEPKQRRPLDIDTDDRFLLGITLVGGLIWLTRKAVLFAKGGFGLRLTGPFWGSYWREREYRADAFAARLGQGAALAYFLELHALAHDQPVPFIWLTEHTHPPTELRIERLRAANAVAAGEATISAGDELAPEDTPEEGHGPQVA